MITAADYADWAHFAGLYVRNVSHADRYRTYAAKLSPPGVVTRLVQDFLQDNRGGINLDAWRSQAVYEIGADARDRLNRTADALEAVGATRAAARVRTAEDNSLLGQMQQQFLGGGPMPDVASLMKNVDLPGMMAEFRANVARMMPDVARARGFPEAESKPVPVDSQMETREQIEHLLVEYVRAHRVDLQADMDRHGDPRRAPGFDPARREKEIQQIRQREIDREMQVEQAEALGRALEKLERQLAKSTKPSESKNRVRREVLDGYNKYADKAPADLQPPMAAWLAKARSVIDAHPSFFHPQPIDDAALLGRLDKIGPYEVDFDASNVSVRWNEPLGLECDWTEFALTVVFPAKKKKALRERLDRVDRMRRRWVEHQETLKQEILNSFAIHHEQQSWLADDYEKDDDGQPTAAAIFEHAGNGGIRIGGEEEGDSISIFFHVDWDDEHGLELWVDDEQEPDSADEAAAVAVGIQDVGPVLATGDLVAFEERTGLKLPADYRSFLLRSNGGRPASNHLVSKGQGGLALDINFLYSLSEVEAAWRAHCQSGYPAHLLPIGLANAPNPMMGGDVEATVLIQTSSLKAGKVLVSMAGVAAGMPGLSQEQQQAMAAAMAQMYEAQCMPAAASFAKFLGQLIRRPNVVEPEWLQAIAAGDADRLLAWHGGGGKFSETFARYGDPMPRRVVDYLAAEASTDVLQALVAAKAVKPRELVVSWGQWCCSTARLRALLPIMDRHQRIEAFRAHDIWSHPDLLEELRQSGVNLEGAVDDEGSTPLHMATRASSVSGMRWLLSHGVSPSKADKYARTALVWAESNVDLECLKVLLEAGLKLDSLFPGRATVGGKLILIRGRWGAKFAALEEYLKSAGADLSGL
ncbi:MAG TPA: ankyrin repeat domain-containing protein [Gemmataceae bacterium]|jgi:hypothetical protein|nr:ankyrin repeat domain-containing protein [Gemmataceae bacterium]